jgi:hypothetical protein
MAAISQKVIGLIGGVSQQPDSLMIPGQLRECDNYYPDPTFGLLKRPGTKFIQRLENATTTGDFFFISKGDDDKLIFQINQDGTVGLWDAQSGVEQTLNAISGTAQTYATHDHRSDIEVLQINDYVFVLNRGILVEDDGVSSAAQTPYGYVTLTTIAYDTSYRIVIDGTAFTYNSPTSSGSNLSAQTIINALVSSINANPAYVATGVANFIHIRRANNADFSLEASGSISGTGLKAYKGSVSGVEDLPDQFLDGEVIKVGASQEADADDYYVVFETSDGSAQGAGVWVETIGPDVPLGVDATTMPHALIKEADGTYTFRELSEAAAAAYTTSTTVSGIPTAVSVTSNGNARWSVGQRFPVYGGTGINLRLEVTSVDANRQITGVSIIRAGQDYTAADVVSNLEGDTFTVDTVGSATISGSTWATQYWGQRTVGDEESAPSPSFVGERITGISFFKNRLVLLSQENVVCSQAGAFLDFYPSTVITIVNSDPIDISAGSRTKVEFRHGLQHPTGLITFADNAQYILQTRTEAFSASTAELNLLSTFSHSVTTKPIDLGTTFVIAEQNSKSTILNELTLGFDQTPLKKDLSKLIPSYIPTGITTITNTLSASLFGLQSVQEPDTLYLFRYYTQDSERLVASWFKWTFPGNLLLSEFAESEGYVAIECDNEVVLTHMNLLTESPGGAILFEGEYIDLRMDLFDYNPEVAYDAGTDETRIFFKEGAEIASAQPCLVFLTPGDSAYVQYPELEHDAGAPAGQQYYVALPNDETANQFALGYQITSDARLPGFYIKKDKIADELNVPVVHRVRVYSHESGPFEAVLNVPGRNEFTLTLPQITANLTPFNQAPMLRTAENIIPIMAKGKDADLRLVCSAPFPLALVNMTWEGTYNNKGIRSV